MFLQFGVQCFVKVGYLIEIGDVVVVDLFYYLVGMVVCFVEGFGEEVFQIFVIEVEQVLFGYSWIWDEYGWDGGRLYDFVYGIIFSVK